MISFHDRRLIWKNQVSFDTSVEKNMNDWTIIIMHQRSNKNVEIDNKDDDDDFDDDDK